MFEHEAIKIKTARPALQTQSNGGRPTIQYTLFNFSLIIPVYHFASECKYNTSFRFLQIFRRKKSSFPPKKCAGRTAGGQMDL